MRTTPRVLKFRRVHHSVDIESASFTKVTWFYEVESEDEAVSELAFPVYYTNSPTSGNAPQIEIRTIHVNGQSIPPDQVLAIEERRELLTQEARLEWGGVDYVEYGRIRIPVDFRQGRNVCEIRVVIALTNVFSNPVDQVYVDIPYVTDDLEVTVSSVGHTVRRAPASDNNSIHARSAMNVLDSAESTDQSRLLRQERDVVVWRTASAKVGYRYTVHIRSGQV